MKKQYRHAMTIRMTDKVMDVINQKSEELGISKNRVVQVILEKVADQNVSQIEKEQRA